MRKKFTDIRKREKLSGKREEKEEGNKRNKIKLPRLEEEYENVHKTPISLLKPYKKSCISSDMYSY